jgi:YgiT-type zinc finger domain-containing protein
MACKHIEKFNPKKFGFNMVVQYDDGETKEFIGYTCEYCPKCGERIYPDPHDKKFDENEEEAE